MSKADLALIHNNEKLVYDWNQVTVSGTKIKVQFRYLYRSRFFFPKPKLKFSNFLKTLQVFLLFPTFRGDISFYKLENKPKNNLKILQIWQQIWF